jgi:hypothetical protein
MDSSSSPPDSSNNPPDSPNAIIARLTERCSNERKRRKLAEKEKAKVEQDAKARVEKVEQDAKDQAAEAKARVEKVENELGDHRVKVGRLEERLEAANARAQAEKANVLAEKANVQAEKANVLAEKENVIYERSQKEKEQSTAAFFAKYSISQSEKLVEAHKRLISSHGCSIENPAQYSKQPVVALLDASRSPQVRERHKLPEDDFPQVFKMVEGQRGNHVQKELKRLCEKQECSVLIPPVYYPNGISLRESIRKRLPEWTLEQAGVRFMVERS